MKKLLFAIALTSVLFSCKKETTTTATCGDNPNIDITSVGSPIGKFSECIKDVDGNTYKTVSIGNQIWMAENLKTSKYNDGTALPNIMDANKIILDTIGAWSVYNNDMDNNSRYGKLYNWFAINSITNGNKNLCPTGWHVPSDAEWAILTDYLGGENVAGSKMKEVGTNNWKSPNMFASNTSLFTALPGGGRNIDGSYLSVGTHGYWWSSTHHFTFNAMSFSLNVYVGVANRSLKDKQVSMSVRCLKD